MKKIYAEISKTEAQDDGTLKVWGYASSEAVDSDGETITSDAMKAALPDYMKWGAVREMHQPSAAGTAIEANVDDTGKTYFGAHIVDPIAVKKVQTGTYKGFSIGGKVMERDELNKTIIKAIKLVEVSLVDRPANPEAVFTMYKSEEADDLSKTDEATPEAPVQKGMYNVANLAGILSSISWIATDEEWEKQMEGDESPIPQDLRTWLTMGCEIFQAMAAEETAEMIANLQAMAPNPDPDPMAMADSPDGLEKAGATLSAATKEKISIITEAIAAAMGHLDALLSGTVTDTTDDDKTDADEIKDLWKVAQDTAEKLVKSEAENADLKKRVAELEARPAPSKAVIHAMVISKDEDSDAIAKAQEEEFAKMTPEQKAEYEIRKLYRK
jgi:hypothetical protein